MITKKRWLFYCIVGFLFGIADWYYLNWLAHFSWGELGNSLFVIPVIIALNYGIWLVPVLPVTLYESKISGSARRSAIAGALCWSCSILSYYLLYTLLLAFWGLPQMDHLLMINQNQPDFWLEWKIAFQKIILNQVLEWLPIAIVGGAIIGLLVWWISHRRFNKA